MVCAAASPSPGPGAGLPLHRAPLGGDGAGFTQTTAARQLISHFPFKLRYTLWEKHSELLHEANYVAPQTCHSTASTGVKENPDSVARSWLHGCRSGEAAAILLRRALASGTAAEHGPEMRGHTQYWQRPPGCSRHPSLAAALCCPCTGMASEGRALGEARGKTLLLRRKARTWGRAYGPWWCPQRASLVFTPTGSGVRTLPNGGAVCGSTRCSQGRFRVHSKQGTIGNVQHWLCCLWSCMALSAKAWDEAVEVQASPLLLGFGVFSWGWDGSCSPYSSVRAEANRAMLPQQAWCLGSQYSLLRMGVREKGRPIVSTEMEENSGAQLSQPGLDGNLATELTARWSWSSLRVFLAAKSFQGKKKNHFLNGWWHREFSNLISNYFSVSLEIYLPVLHAREETLRPPCLGKEARQQMHPTGI